MLEITSKVGISLIKALKIYKRHKKRINENAIYFYGIFTKWTWSVYITITLDKIVYNICMPYL